MQISRLSASDLDNVMDLFGECFFNDHYYAQIFRDPNTRLKEMRDSFSPNIKSCLDGGHSFGIKHNGSLIAFLICFDYLKTKEENTETFISIFGGESDDLTDLPYYDSIHKEICNTESPVMFCLSIAVKPEYRRQGLACALIENLISTYKEYRIAGDVSNGSSLNIYSKRNFRIVEVDTEYYLIIRDSVTVQSASYETGIVKLAVPSTKLLEKHNIKFKIIHERFAIPNIDTLEYYGYEHFTNKPGNITFATVAEIDYKGLLLYQRAVNLSQSNEHIVEDVLYYVLSFPYENPLIFNDVLSEMVPVRKAEWSIVPDVYVSVPLQYQNIDIIKKSAKPQDHNAYDLLRDLDYRTHYEAGVPSSLHGVDELANLKNRIERYYLGKIKVRILSETTVDNYKDEPEAIGEAAYVDMYITLDNGSDCAVITWYSLSLPFLISHYMDNIIRNQLHVFSNGKWQNLFDYLNSKYQVVKRGTPKMYVTIPENKNCLTDNQLASLLASETIYPEGESFGNIIDSEIVEAVTSPVGMGQYDRGYICAYTNVILQFSPDLKCSVNDRFSEESIALFFIELILMEEAAIHIADQSMIKLFTSKDFEDPVMFLKQVDGIYDNYSKTIDFWDIQVNYPTSQKSMLMMREAFKINKQLEYMQRTREQLQTVFDTKCDIIDRKDSKRTNTSLAIISMLAILSAWMDGYDYIATWSDVFSESTINILQKIIFTVILLVGVYAITHLFGGKLRKIIKRQGKKSKKKK